jgi:RNA polymerase sigma-70 factor (ECF subfamily)
MSTSAVNATLVGVLTVVPPEAPLADAGTRDTAEIRTLVTAAANGDREAFGQLVTTYEQVAYRTALAALGRAEDAEEAAQEAFVLAWRHLGTFRGEASFRTWLLRIVWRRAHDRRRLRWRHWRWTADSADGMNPLEAVPSNSADPEQRAVAADLRRRVAARISRLSPKLRDALLLAATGEHSYTDIGVTLGIPVGTVKWRVSEARRQVSAAIRGDIK